MAQPMHSCPTCAESGSASSTCFGASQIPISRNRHGTIGFRIFTTSSTAWSGHGVPFYFQPTIGGRDINGLASLPSYEDYRFRGPHVFLMQQSFEHSIYGPVGAFLQADQGRVANTRGDLGLRHLRRSYSVGVTIRAGGFPMLVASYGFGGKEGRHLSLTMNTSLLGGSSRPKLD